MFNSAVLDVAIGIAFVYLFLSLICSVVNEGIAAVLSLRSKNLVAGINNLFSGSELAPGKSLVGAIYAHGLIRGLYKDPAQAITDTQAKGGSKAPEQADDKSPAAEAALLKPGEILNHMPVLEMVNKWFNVNLPAYIPSGTFATALIDVVSPPDANKPRTLDDVRAAINKLPPSAIQQALLSLVADTPKELSDFQQKVESWFNDSMDRASGVYKRRAQNILLAIGLAVTLVLNVDSIKLAQTLWNDPIARQATVDLAQKYVHDNTAALQNPTQLKDQATDLAKLRQQLPFPIGWHVTAPQPPQQTQSTPTPQPAKQEQTEVPLRTNIILKLETVIGWLITTLALSLGAPFWFDTLNKFMVVRSTVKPQEKSKPEPSKDA